MLLQQKTFAVSNFIWLSFFLSIALFKFVPSLDIFITTLFYQDNSFFLQHTMIESFFYKSIRPIIAILSIVSLGVFFYNLSYKKNIFSLTKRKIIYIILVLALVPGIVVQYGLKNQFERPRPREVVLFGGTKQFYPAYTFTHEGKKSFSSGHVAAAFSLVGIAMLCRRRKRFFLFLTSTYATMMMVARIAAGAHFFSDVITSFFIVYIANKILYNYIIENSEEKNI